MKLVFDLNFLNFCALKRNFVWVLIVHLESTTIEVGFFSKKIVKKNFVIFFFAQKFFRTKNKQHALCGKNKNIKKISKKTSQKS